MGMQLIQTIQLSTSTNSIEFTGLPQDATDLVCICSWNATASGTFEFDLQLNGVGNSFLKRLWANGSSASGSENDQITVSNSDSPTANTFHSLSVHVYNYALSGNHQFSWEAAVESNNSGTWSNYLVLGGAQNDSTNAVTSLKLLIANPAFAQNSMASLYKITAD